MRKSAILVVIVFMFLFAAVASAETSVMRVDFELSSDDKVTLRNIATSIGTFEENTDESLPYQILLVDEDEVFHLLTFDETFLRMTNPPSVLDQKIISKKLPYYGNVGELMIYHDERLAFKYDLKNLCNYDFVCSGFETDITCPSDCISELRENAEKIQVYRDKKEKEITGVEDQVMKRNKQFAIIITIVLMLIALFLIIILTKGNKKTHGKRR
ncbi:hypothetical protein KY335_05840 [Candidatus Woesearchaeota archaeon]|nr:hypothetical protein [Candidatus Woesearchaeota archaeon]